MDHASRLLVSAAPSEPALLLRSAAIEVNEATYEIHRDGRRLCVEPRVYALIVCLLRNRHRVVTKRELFDTVWSGAIVGDSALTRCVSLARKALGGLIRNVHGRGYRWLESEAERAPDDVVLGAALAVRGDGAPERLGARGSAHEQPDDALRRLVDAYLAALPAATRDLLHVAAAHGYEPHLRAVVRDVVHASLERRDRLCSACSRSRAR